MLTFRGATASAGSFRPIGIHQNLARFACFQARHGLRKIFHRNPVGNDGMQIEFAAFQKSRHLVQGLVHTAPVDALDRQAFENDVFGKVQRNGL